MPPPPPWYHLHFHKDENNWLYAVKAADDLVSWNDGDVCNAAVTELVLKSSTAAPPICVDIGVDEGWWSTFCLGQSANVKVYAFEPNPVSVEKLRTRFTLEPRIEIIPKAVSNTDEGIPFVLDGPQSNSRAETDSRVPSTRLDFLFERHARVDLMKIDTEGHEFAILSAIAPHFKAIGTLIFEFTPRWYGASPSEATERSISMLERVIQEFPYMYTFSRRGPPQLTQIESEDDIYPFVIQNYQCQTDIVCSRVALELPPFEQLSPPQD